MGTQVTADDRSNTKPNYTVATVAFGAVAIVDGEFAVWVGDSVSTNVEAYNGLLKCVQALREAHWPNPLTTTFNSAKYSTTTHTLTVALGAALPTVAETDVVVLQGLDFTPAGVTNSPHVRRMAEMYLESDKAA